ncbi:MAG: long-chain acyl-CoA synthetase [Actinomycetota bacterium]|jgi:long-chain acyl-CoA synthetase|nr:long-chain acyl-CoA synthetase [Actinomycetota bacterium]
MNLADLLADSARSHPEKTALIVASSGEAISYADVNAEANRVAAGLTRAGLTKGDRVAIGMHNVPHFAYAYFGILRAGGVVVPLNIMLTPTELARILKDSGAKALLAAPPFAQGASAAAKDAGIDLYSTEDWDRLGDRTDSFDAIAANEDDLAVLAYTSGTTGEPKGAMLTHGNLLANLRQQMSIPEAHVTDQDVLFLALPLFHIFGLNVTMGLLAMNAATGLLVERFEPIAALRAIQDHKVTVLFGAPTMYSAWVNTPGAEQYDLSSVRLAISGAAPLSAEVLKDFKDMFGVTIYEGYGLTETAPTLWSNRMTDIPRPGSVGKPLPDVEFRLLGEDGNEVELGDPGEIVVRGPNVFKGYWQRDEDTANAFLDGWFRTGDIGVVDEEGYLYLVDRKRDLIIVSGFNVFPSEVEMALLQSPKIAEAAVVGVTHPYTGEAVKAYVVLNSGASATEAEIIEDVATRLARFKCPQSVEIVEDLPHLLTGKVLRRALRT